ncbi:FecR family protein [Mucilaginibacter paludis]|uniref:Anti-FecI sigma factor, FecR n=1 Tax=Mucilaginibacter paludis DSM 18603 TaxID=714943 RepID=H1Y944_9SPHI|nr:FecR family protein [Mucilaginibacter paludis]EHQ29082.1 anti-FecI sigma factor, FecR [Mucilaginibacter paludis DSM 18603]
MDIKQLEKLFSKYLSGEASPIERSAIDRWFEQTEKNTVDLTPDQRIRIAGELLHRIKPKAAQPVRQTKAVLYTMISPILRIAAVLAILTTGVFVYRYFSSSPPVQQTSAYRIYQTRKGERVLLTMPDRSKIWLNSATRFRYPAAFNAQTREVYLDSGEAFFEVRHKAQQPFIVHSGNLDTRVLGTSFNISNDPDDHQFAVSVNTGRVSVMQINRKQRQVLALLSPDQGLVLNTLTGKYETRATGMLQQNAWKDNILLFRDAGFREIKRKLENWYGLTVILKRPAGENCLFTARFKNKPIGEVLRSLQQINDFKYRMKGKTLWIDNPPCN